MTTNGERTMEIVVDVARSNIAKKVYELIALVAILGTVGVWAADTRYVRNSQLESYRLKEQEQRYIDRRDELQLRVANPESLNDKAAHIDQLMLKQVKNKLEDVRVRQKRLKGN